MSDSDSDNEDKGPDMFVLQEVLSESTLAALLNFLPNRRFEADDEAYDEAYDNSNPLTAKDVCIAYTPKDVNVIAETLKRLQIKNMEKEVKHKIAVEKRILLKLEDNNLDNNLCEILLNKGIIRLNNVLSHDLCDKALVSINNKLKNDIINNNEQIQETGYGNVLCRDNRWDLYLRNEGVYNEVLSSIFNKDNIIYNLFKELFYDSIDIEFHELSALISDFGAASQPIHPDSMFTKDAPLYTIFIALQDVTEEMGATIFLPSTNTLYCHEQHKSNLTKDDFLSTCEYRQSLLKKGDIAIMDSRTLHCGDANTDSRRVLLYLTLRCPNTFHTCDPPIPTGSKWADMILKMSDIIPKNEFNYNINK